MGTTDAITVVGTFLVSAVGDSHDYDRRLCGRLSDRVPIRRPAKITGDNSGDLGMW